MLSKIRLTLSITMIFICSGAFAGEENLTIKSDNNLLQQFSKEQLRSRSDIETITITGNPAFSYSSHTYQAFQLCHLLKSFPIPAAATIEFKALDGYVTVIAANLVRQCAPAIDTAYLAIEPQEKWPPLPHGSGTAGPYDLIWRSTGKNIVSPHYWPWQVTEINIKTQNTPGAQLPAPDAANKRVLAGYETFIQSCSGCHTMNGYGSSHMGPDLNKPLNPVQYFKSDTVLKQFIRYPQSIREYKNDRMPGVADTMSEKDLDNLIVFFHYMAWHKQVVPH